MVSGAPVCQCGAPWCTPASSHTCLPTLCAGAISASAPVLLYPNTTSPYDPNQYWQVVTDDATAANPQCSKNVRASWEFLFAQSNVRWALVAQGCNVSTQLLRCFLCTPQSTAGLEQLSQVANTCTPLQSAADVYALAIYLLNAWDTMAMGQYPYPDNYMTGGGVACVLTLEPLVGAVYHLRAPHRASAACFSHQRRLRVHELSQSHRVVTDRSGGGCCRCVQQREWNPDVVSCPLPDMSPSSSRFWVVAIPCTFWLNTIAAMPCLLTSLKLACCGTTNGALSFFLRRRISPIIQPAKCFGITRSISRG